MRSTLMPETYPCVQLMSMTKDDEVPLDATSVYFEHFTVAAPTSALLSPARASDGSARQKARTSFIG